MDGQEEFILTNLRPRQGPEVGLGQLELSCEVEANSRASGAEVEVEIELEEADDEVEDEVGLEAELELVSVVVVEAELQHAAQVSFLWLLFLDLFLLFFLIFFSFSSVLRHKRWLLAPISFSSFKSCLTVGSKFLFFSSFCFLELSL